MLQTENNFNIVTHFEKSNLVIHLKWLNIWNAYLATKVIFCNEMYNICEKLSISYDKAREIWIVNPRIGSNYTFVYKTVKGISEVAYQKIFLLLLNKTKKED